MYAIMGVTGKVGGAAARALLADGKPLRVLVRDAAKGKPWAELGCAPVIAGLDNPAALTSALQDCEAAFVMLPPAFDPSPDFREGRAMIATLRTALERARPKRVVALSTIGAEAARPNLLNQLGLLEQALSTLDLPVTFLRAAWFMQNAALDVAAAKETGVIQSYLQPLDRPVSMISAEDVGRTVAALLTESWQGVRVIELDAGGVSPNQIAAAFGKALGRPVRANVVPRAEWEQIFRSQGMTNPLPRMQMIDGFNEGWIAFGRPGTIVRKGQIGIDEAIAGLLGG
ncbi:NmrA family transcriptional regulator [Bradyrhizobium sp. LTSPM299]|uniref:NmrA family NAD(P)-binding protein n=1 Tax=Bradyrhizobium sp. LTSPM299 TaxID=1619233 RepID=UPI0005CA95FD|nr:NmrA family NAD(P)-binding protein [Bradyrhizobium sp. LTSPM299]KJC59474.1 NmrA family transcriptional regulator [Bradyrhizobium sp. LTSPM299]